MNCKKYKIMLSSYIDGELAPKQIGQIEKHLPQCSSCQKELSSLQEWKNICRKLHTTTTAEHSWGDFSDRLFTKLKNQEQEQANVKSMPRWLHCAVGIMLLVFLVSPFFLINLTVAPSQPGERGYRLDILSSVDSKENQEVIEHKQIKVNPNIKQPSLEHIKGLSQAKLTNKEADFLLQNGFVVTPHHFSSFANVYEENHKNGIPSFITMDTAISGFSHILARLRVDLER